MVKKEEEKGGYGEEGGFERRLWQRNRKGN